MNSCDNWGGQILNLILDRQLYYNPNWTDKEKSEFFIRNYFHKNFPIGSTTNKDDYNMKYVQTIISAIKYARKTWPMIDWKDYDTDFKDCLPKS